MVLTATVPVCDSQTQTDPSTSLVSTTSQGIQVGEFPNRPYQSYECRKQSELRTEIIEKIVDLFNIYVHGDSLALPNLVQDLLLSKKWSTTFCLPSNKDDSAVQDKVLHSIVKEYRECKNKEANSQIRKQGRKLNQAINISETLANSSVAFQGSTPDCSRSRTEAACSMGRVVCYSAERRRLLSIVAWDYPQVFLTKLFQCSKSTITPQEFTASCLAEEEYPQHLWNFLASASPEKYSISWLISSWEMTCQGHHLAEVW